MSKKSELKTLKKYRRIHELMMLEREILDMQGEDERERRPMGFSTNSIRPSSPDTQPLGVPQVLWNGWEHGWYE